LLLSLVFNSARFFEYLKALLSKGTFGFSDIDYPQTVQHFILVAFPHSLYKFLLVLAVFLCSLGIYLFILNVKKEMNRDFSQLSAFLRMSRCNVLKQARLAALPKQALFWSFLAPVILVFLLIIEAKFNFPGLGNTIKTAFDKGDISLFYGSCVSAFLFVLASNLFFLALRTMFPRK
jgi:ABC-type dipeptide/oligopeptide/nickel transport system permease component